MIEQLHLRFEASVISSKVWEVDEIEDEFDCNRTVLL